MLFEIPCGCRWCIVHVVSKKIARTRYVDVGDIMDGSEIDVLCSFLISGRASGWDSQDFTNNPAPVVRDGIEMYALRRKWRRVSRGGGGRRTGVSVTSDRGGRNIEDRVRRVRLSGGHSWQA